jgi:hypothetical protein
MRLNSGIFTKSPQILELPRYHLQLFGVNPMAFFKNLERKCADYIKGKKS